MTPAHPLVSVVMPAYNHAEYVGRAIQSVLSQDYEPVELVVVDDGSTDNTWNEIQRLLIETSGRFRALRQSNQGVCKTLNRGVRETRGQFVAVLASDDYYLPGKLGEQSRLLQQASKQTALVHTSSYLDYQNGRALEDLTGSYRPAVGLCFDDILTQDVRIIAPSMMFRRTAFDEVGGFDEALAAEDVDFFLRLAAAGMAFAYIDRPMMVKTVVEGSGGSQLKRLITVHEQILQKHSDRLPKGRVTELQNLMYEHLIMLSAGAGDYELASHTAIERAIKQQSISPLLKLARWSLRAAVLRSLPPQVRHRLRLLRAKRRGG